MRKVREVLRLRWSCGLSKRQVARSAGVGRTAVREYLERAEIAGLSWGDVSSMSDDELERRLFPSVQAQAPARLPSTWLTTTTSVLIKGSAIRLSAGRCCRELGRSKSVSVLADSSTITTGERHNGVV